MLDILATIWYLAAALFGILTAVVLACGVVIVLVVGLGIVREELQEHDNCEP